MKQEGAWHGEEQQMDKGSHLRHLAGDRIWKHQKIVLGETGGGRWEAAIPRLGWGALNETVLGQPLPGIWECLGAGQSESCLLGSGLGGCRNIPSHPVQRERVQKRAVPEFVPRGESDWSSESYNWDWGILGLCGQLLQGTGCRACSPPLPRYFPCFGVPGSALSWSGGADPRHVCNNPPERVSLPPPQPPRLSLSSAFAPPAAPGPSPRGSCLSPAPHRGRFPVGGFDSCPALCADVCWWHLPKEG